MAKDITGSLRRVTLDGVTYDVMPDSNVKEPGSKYKNEPIVTSGRTMRKMTAQSEAREGVVVACNGAEREQLKALAERTGTYAMSYELASGDVYRCTGFIEFESRETEENRATLMLCNTTPWDPFLA